MLLSGCFLVVEVSKDVPSRGHVRLNMPYHRIYKLVIDEADHNLLRVRMIDAVNFDLLFSDYKGSTASKIRLEECRFASAKFVFGQITAALNKSIQECSLRGA